MKTPGRQACRHVCHHTGPPARPAREDHATLTRTARTLRVTLAWELASAVLRLTATTPRRGTSFSDSWSISPSLALIAVTVADPRSGTGRYVSRAEVDERTLAHDTTYTFSYAIVMRTATSAWVGSGSVAVTVGADGSLVPPDESGH